MEKLHSSKKSTQKKTQIKEFKYVIMSDLKIGEGEFSETFQAYRYDKGAPIKIAAKRLKAVKDKNDQTTAQLLSEISALTELGNHENVIEYLGFFTSTNEMFMIFEFAERGDLKHYLDNQRKGKKDILLNKLRISYEIANGMEYVSSLDIVHKDLAARNILLDSNYRSKISDFGCCKMEFMEKLPSKIFLNIN
jgi:serine/threonine protein kinase